MGPRLRAGESQAQHFTLDWLFNKIKNKRKLPYKSSKKSSLPQVPMILQFHCHSANIYSEYTISQTLCKALSTSESSQLNKADRYIMKKIYVIYIMKNKSMYYSFYQLNNL